MNTYDIIMKKRDGNKLSNEEIEYMVNGFTDGSIPDYQMSAWLMAVFLKGMDEEETTNLTLSMAKSGDMLSLDKIRGVKVDKHSTGGVGDKTSLIVGPIIASLSIPVAKMSGRGLGHTGGTIDKLESIPGFNTSICEEDFIKQVNDIGLSIVGQTANLAPADKKIYALRDVTATVDNYSLIASSIMSKKLAAGADKIVLDVKVGSGAFMKTYEDAVKLSETMVKIGNNAGRKTIAVITDMNEPLGNMIGNNLEVKEAIECLSGKGEKRLMAVTKELCINMIMLAGLTDNRDEAASMVDSVINDGRALNKLKEFVKAQGGDDSYIDDPSKFDEASIKRVVYGRDIFKTAGFNGDKAILFKCNNSEIGMASLLLGGGRLTKESEIDLTVGIELKKHLGDELKADDVFAVLYGNDEAKTDAAEERFLNAYSLSDNMPETKVIYDVIA